MICLNWDPVRIKKTLKDGLKACGEGICHIHLKDIETVQGEPERMKKWSHLAREAAEEACDA